MVQLPDWKRPVVVLTDAAQVRQTQARDAVTDLFDRTRDRIGQLPRAVYDEARRRVGALEFATKQDLETESRLARNRVAFLLKEFLDEQQGRDAQLRETLRTELREELQVFASAIEDGAFGAGDALLADDNLTASRSRTDIDYLDEDDDDDLDDLEDLDDGLGVDVSLDDDLEIEGYGGFHIDRAAIEHADIDR
jgi:glutathione S-transferase